MPHFKVVSVVVFIELGNVSWLSEMSIDMRIMLEMCRFSLAFYVLLTKQQPFLINIDMSP